MAGRVEGKVALVTGGGSGIGRACAVRFAKEGANVCVADLDLKGATETAQMVEGAGRKSVAVQVDIDRRGGQRRDGRALRRGASAAIDVLVAAAGVGSPRACRKRHVVPRRTRCCRIPMEPVPAGDRRQSLRRAVLEPRGGALDDRSTRRGGSIINLASIMSQMPSHERAPTA